MARPQIIDKLDSFLTAHDPFTEECHVVYLMVQLRKLLDHRSDRTSFPKLRFYCDWTVHTEKRWRLETLRPVIQEVYEGVRTTLKTFPDSDPASYKPVLDFLHLRDLRAELESFFAAEQIASQHLDGRWWQEFVGLMVNVLSDQPILNPIPELRSFTFTHATRTTVDLRVEFSMPVRVANGMELPYFEFGQDFGSFSSLTA